MYVKSCAVSTHIWHDDGHHDHYRQDILLLDEMDTIRNIWHHECPVELYPYIYGHGSGRRINPDHETNIPSIESAR